MGLGSDGGMERERCKPAAIIVAAEGGPTRGGA